MYIESTSLRIQTLNEEHLKTNIIILIKKMSRLTSNNVDIYNIDNSED